MDKRYWHKLRKGDEEAFMEMYDAYYSPLYAFGYRLMPDKELVKDAIHELYCELWEKRFSLPEVTQEKSYLFTYLKRKIRKETVSLGKITTLEQTNIKENELPYETLLIQSQTQTENKIKLEKLLTKISPAQLQIIEHKFFGLLSYEEIAQRMQLQPRTVYNQVYEALKTMRSHLKILISIF